MLPIREDKAPVIVPEWMEDPPGNVKEKILELMIKVILDYKEMGVTVRPLSSIRCGGGSRRCRKGINSVGSTWVPKVPPNFLQRF